MYISSSFQGPNQLTRSHFLKANGQTVLTLKDGDHPLEFRDSFYTFSDHLGSACTLMEAGGHIISREYHTPFGETAYSTPSRARYRYCGKEKDSESELYYYGARYYSAWTCRFVSVDPLAEKAMSINSYAYCKNNPLNLIDPTGMETIDDQAKHDNITSDPPESKYSKAMKSIFEGSIKSEGNEFSPGGACYKVQYERVKAAYLKAHGTALESDYPLPHLS